MAAQGRDPEPDHTFYATLFYGRTFTIISSHDVRTGGGFALSYARREPRLRIGSARGQLVLEGYYHDTSDRGVRGDPATFTNAVGALVYIRDRLPINKSTDLYFDIGIGVQYVDQRTRDLDSSINSTPMLALGAAFNKGRHETLVGLRYLHVSNAGTVGDNRGQNGFYLTVGFRF